MSYVPGLAKSSILDCNRFNSMDADSLDPTTRELVKRRESCMGSSYRLFYKRPLNLVKGEGEYLWDAEGNKYLDAYNNIPSMGHSHPKIVEAVHEQMKKINTHTRYLHENIINYSERLLSLMPKEIDRAMYMCSGSEANDLALRICMAYTGGTGILISQEAYHGNTQLVSAISPSIGGGQKLLGSVRLVPTPDFYRFGDDAEGFTKWYCDEIQKQIDDMKAHGIKLACFIADSIFSSDGVLPYPKGFLKAAVDVVHKNGGLFIGDEVQPGFCRSGDSFWGFLRHGITPDLVTMGKPMANGIPCSGLCGKHEILEAFSEKFPYFNTFAGNPVSMAAAIAVLDVIEKENVLEHTKTVGADFLKALKEVQAKHGESVGDARGAGLFIGIEFVKDSESKTPDPELAQLVINKMYEKKILTSNCGPYGNVLKVRPPLVFKSEDIDWFVSALDESLTELNR